MDLSFVIVNWNSKDYLRKCLRSVLLGCPPGRSEILVVDNASRDGSAQMVRNEFPSVVLMCNEKNTGFAAANNIGLRRASGRYVFLLNPDVDVLDGCLERMVAYMDSHPRIGMLAPRILNGDSSLQPSSRRFPTLLTGVCRVLALDRLFPRIAFLPHDGTRSAQWLSGCFWMVRREALNEIGLLDERFFMYAEDIDWCRRFSDSGWDLVYYPEAQAIHFGGASSANAPLRCYLQMQRANLQYWKKHKTRAAYVAFVLLTVLYHGLRTAAAAVLYLVLPRKRDALRFQMLRGGSCLRWLLGGPCPADDSALS